MKNLNLPPFEYKITRENSGIRIFDIIRKKYVVLTPEEWVRQHFIHYLISRLHYPKSLIKVESGLKYNRMSKRSDIVVYDRSGAPFLLVECKSSEQQMTKNSLFQVITYNRTIQARYVVITNGLVILCGKTGNVDSKITWMDSLPPFP